MQKWNAQPVAKEGAVGLKSTQGSSQQRADDEVLIELRDVWKTFGDKAVLQGANIKIRRGEAVGIIGGSGTGKSTTLRLMAGLLMPDQVNVLHNEVWSTQVICEGTLLSRLASAWLTARGIRSTCKFDPGPTG